MPPRILFSQEGYQPLFKHDKEAAVDPLTTPGAGQPPPEKAPVKVPPAEAPLPQAVYDSLDRMKFPTKEERKAWKAERAAAQAPIAPVAVKPRTAEETMIENAKKAGEYQRKRADLWTEKRKAYAEGLRGPADKVPGMTKTVIPTTPGAAPASGTGKFVQTPEDKANEAEAYAYAAGVRQRQDDRARIKSEAAAKAKQDAAIKAENRIRAEAAQHPIKETAPETASAPTTTTTTESDAPVQANVSFAPPLIARKRSTSMTGKEDAQDLVKKLIEQRQIA